MPNASARTSDCRLHRALGFRSDSRCARVLDRRVAARRTLPGVSAAAQRALSRACSQSRAACSEVRLRARHGRAQAAAAGQLRARAHRAARGVEIDHEAAVRHRRSARGPRPGIGGFKAAERDRRRLQGRASVLFHRLPARTQCPGRRSRTSSRAEAIFLERVIALHPDAEGKPAVIGNCQAGWAVMLLAALRPELFGPIIVAGSPLSYWAGVHGENPMRYTGGLLGGSWLTALTGDLGNGKFDGAWLVIELRKPQSGQHAVDEALQSLFEGRHRGAALPGVRAVVGRRMSCSMPRRCSSSPTSCSSATSSPPARSRHPTATRIDLRNIASPIIVFCSKADNITPPPQALDWILDLYESEDDIRAHGQTIVYAVHETIGHLGIFVSGSVAKKEHDEFASNIDLIDVLPPGLYEAVMVPKRSQRSGRRPDRRRLSRALRGAHPRRHPRARRQRRGATIAKFATVARVSEINLGLYRTFVQPWVRLWANEDFAAVDAPAASAAPAVRDVLPRQSVHAPAAVGHWRMRASNREPVPADNPLLAGAGAVLELDRDIARCLSRYARSDVARRLFHAVYGSPLLQALVGLKASDGPLRARPGQRSPRTSRWSPADRGAEGGIPEGGPREAAIRALLYVRMPDGVVDERGFNLLRRMREEAGSGMTLGEFKRVRARAILHAAARRAARRRGHSRDAREGSCSSPTAWRAMLRQVDRSRRPAQRARQGRDWPRSGAPARGGSGDASDRPREASSISPRSARCRPCAAEAEALRRDSRSDEASKRVIVMADLLRPKDLRRSLSDAEMAKMDEGAAAQEEEAAAGSSSCARPSCRATFHPEAIDRINTPCSIAAEHGHHQIQV